MGTHGRLFRLVAGTSLIVATCAGSALAQTPASPQPMFAGSLTELAAELRLLRAAIEEGTRRQNETQAISIYLSAQSRMVQLSTRLDTVRNELADSTAELQEMQLRANGLQQALERPLPADERRGIEEMLPTLKTQDGQDGHNKAR